MAVYGAMKGKAFLLKIGNGATTEVFTTVGGLRATGITINNTAVDITDKESNSWQTLLADAGGRNITITAGGILKDSVTENTLRTNAMNAAINNYTIVFGDGGTFKGGFIIETMGYSGDHNGVVEYTLSMKSSGVITFTGGT